MKALRSFSVITCVAAFLLGSVVLVPPAGAQAGSGTIFGTVTDPSGAVVAGAKATLLNTATGHVDTAKSNGKGSYVFPAVDVGSYKLTVTASGFQTFVSENIVMQVNEDREIDPRLAVGSISQQVVVRQGQAHVNLRNATITEVIDSRRVKELPLNGRNPLDLQTLVAGAATMGGPGQAENGSISINGGRPDSNNYTLDGVDNEDPFFGSPSIVPNPDALNEFSIQTTNYGARGGRSSGAQVNAVIKSGTNHFHGTLFEYWRNPVLDARPYFSTILAPYRRNQFGGTLGGPVLHNKLFFFFAYQGTRTNASPNSETLFVPSPAELTGDFSELLSVNACNKKAIRVKDPATGKLAPGNKIPASSLSQATLGFAKAFVPQANGACNSYTYTPITIDNQDQYISRIDSNLGQNDTLSGHLVYVDSLNHQNPIATNGLPGFLASIQYTNWHVALNETHVFSPRLLNLFTFGFDRIDRDQLPIMPKKLSWSELGAGIVNASPGAPIGSDTNVQSYFHGNTRWPLSQLRRELQFSDYFSWAVGNHTLSIGGDLRKSFTFQKQSFQTNGALVFKSSFTGNQLADFLTGYPDQIKQQSTDDGKPHNLSPDLFFQDDWRVTRRLTLDLGIRWEPMVPHDDLLQHMAQFRPGEQSVIFPQAPAGSVYPGDPGVGPATYSARWFDFSPRVGFAFDFFGNGKTALRGGFGVYNGNIPTHDYNGDALNQPYALAVTINKPKGGLADPYTSIGGSPYPFTPPNPSEYASYQFRLPLQMKGFHPGYRNNRSFQWNMNIQQQLPGNMVSTIAYVGNETAHYTVDTEGNPGLASLNGARQYSDFSIVTEHMSGGHSTYHALQATINRRFRKGFNIRGSYTWSRFIGTGKITNPFDISANRGLDNSDIRNNFVASGIWHLPSPRAANRAAVALLGGWELNAIWHARSGTPFTVTSGVDNSKSHVDNDWADVHGHGRTYPGESRTQQIQHYFNTEIYTVNTVGTFGDSGNNSLIGPGEDLVTLGVVKSLFTSEKVKLLLRAEGFNVFNHPTMGDPNADVSSSKVGEITSAGDPRVGQLALRLEF